MILQHPLDNISDRIRLTVLFFFDLNCFKVSVSRHFGPFSPTKCPFPQQGRNFNKTLAMLAKLPLR